ncbi:Uncharacterised protein [BD1-7 clade bacterium]|uniref:EF-hand domain-containing protein n=1 Tax=BD1-7 clade bacterium TaxID=2029982 RepID=A0A5S9NW92_9GAMM|nr:Uncharacterised protein [BD1-7 clade bacterium]CAA0095616.1 Uncharacterised protein [BD1-7 clade bacterium]
MPFKNLSPVQEQKFRWWFHALDADHDGNLDEADFFDYLYKWDSLFELDKKYAFRDILFRMQHRFWHALTEHAGTDHITPAQWLDYMDHVLKQYRTKYVVEHQVPSEKWGHLLFELMDTDNNNQASRESYSRYILSLAFDNANVDNAWHHLDPENKGYIDRDAFLNRLAEFWLSTDETDHGNYLLAPPSDWLDS